MLLKTKRKLYTSVVVALGQDRVAAAVSAAGKCYWDQSGGV